MPIFQNTSNYTYTLPDGNEYISGVILEEGSIITVWGHTYRFHYDGWATHGYSFESLLGDWTGEHDEVPSTTTQSLPPQNKISMNEEFPEYPSLISLDRFMTTPDLILYHKDLENDVRCYRSDGGFSITLNEDTLLVFEGSKILIYIKRGTQRELEVIRKYVGKYFKITIKNGLWHINDKPCGYRITFNVDGNSVTGGTNFSEDHLNRLAQLDDQIDRYIRDITPEAILASVGRMTNSNKIFTMCVNCNNHNGSHMRGHLQRREINLYLIYSALQYWGNQTPLTSTWKVVELAKSGKVDPGLLVAFKYFFRRLLANDFVYLCKNLKPSPMRWTTVDVCLSGFKDVAPKKANVVWPTNTNTNTIT